MSATRRSSMATRPQMQRRIMLGSLAVEAMREEEAEAGVKAPLLLRARDELVDDDLRHVREVAELGLPDREPVGALEAVAPVEAEHGSLT